MQFVILGLLLTGPLSLYDVRKRFSAGISLFYSASFGSLQRALQHLVDDGSVAVGAAEDDRRGRRLYAVTDLGQARWREWMLAPIPDGSSAETQVLAKVFLLGRLERPDDRDAVLAMIQAHAAAALDTLRTLEAEVDSLATGLADDHRLMYTYQRATLDYGIRAHELMGAWVEGLQGTTT